MATYTATVVADNSSLANFKSWAQAISTGFSTLGWTQTADTGQVNWSSIASVPSSAYVYEIWKAADTQATTLPIYIKMEYGFSSTLVGIRVTVGTGSTGAGVINGAVSFNAYVTTASGISSQSTFANQGGTTYPCYFSGDAGEFRMLMWQGNNTLLGVTNMFGVERSKDSSGAKTTDYFTAVTVNSGTTNTSLGISRQQTTTSGLLVTTFELTLIGLLCTSSSNTGAFNGTVAAFPVFPLLGKVGNPMLGYMLADANDVGDGTTITVASMYGSTHTYVACKTNSTSAGFQRQGMGGNSNGQAPSAVLMRYE